MRNLLLLVLVLACLQSPAKAENHSNCGCFYDSETRNNVQLKVGTSKSGFILYFNGKGQMLSSKNQQKVLALFDTMLSGGGELWPKVTRLRAFRFSTRPDSERPYMIGFRQKHDYTLRIWFSRAELEEIKTWCQEHIK